MPLHLLGKKSWNVYSKENVERVRRDEAAVAAKEEEAERRMQEHDAQRRIAILRGQRPPSPPPDLQLESPRNHRPDDRASSGFDRRKKRRLAGEDDTDRDMRLARENAEAVLATSGALLKAPHRTDSAPLHDNEGHINLFPVNTSSSRKAETNAEAEQEKNRKSREYEDQYTMRFSNAAGKDGLEMPWYAGRRSRPRPADEAADGDPPKESKNVWGRPDPRRQERELARNLTNDPLAFMRKAQQQLKQTEVDRRKWSREKERELRQLENEHKAPRRKRGHFEPDEGIEEFTLDNSATTETSDLSRQTHRSDRASSTHQSPRSERRHRHR